MLARLDEHRRGRAAGKPVDLAALVTGEVERSTGARVPVTARPPGRASSRASAEGLRRMLVNLIDNAVRYAKSGVEVTARREAGGAVLTVSDDGPGIPAADRERAFDRFARLDDARSRDDDRDRRGRARAWPSSGRPPAAHGGTACLEGAAPGLRAVVPAAAPDQPVRPAPAVVPGPSRTGTST